MSATQSAKDSAMSAHLAKRGYPHGRRASSGLTNIPNFKDVGSAAYRRLLLRKLGRVA